jgi:hypothetical protein
MTKKTASTKKPPGGRTVKVIVDNEFTSGADPTSKARRRNPAPVSNVIQLMFREIAETREKALRTQAEIDLLTEQTREALQRLKAA